MNDTPNLTSRESEILALIAQGFTNPQIADKVSLSKETVKWYRKRLLTKFAASNSVEMVRIASELKLI